MSRPNLRSLSCPNCGAHIQAQPDDMRVLCQYCGQTFDVTQPPRFGAYGPGVAGSGGAPKGAIIGVVTAITLVALGAGVVAVLAARGASTNGGASIPGVSMPGSPTSATTGVMWDTVGGPPIATQIGGHDAFVGRLRTQGTDLLSIAAFDSTKLTILWQTPALGTYTEGYQSTFTAVVGHDVVVTDYRANVHVYDLATGKESRTAKLTDRAGEMCASPDGSAKAFIVVTDKKDVMLDADAGTLTPAPRPAWCPDRFGMSGSDCRGWLSRGAARADCKGPELSPKVSGFGAKNTVVVGDLGVAAGIKEPGTAVPMVVGFDPATKAVRWQQSVASGDQADVETNTTISLMDDLVGGRFVTPYQRTSKGWFFTAFDARTGQRIWDVPLQPLIGVDYPEGFSLSETRVYVMRTSSLEVYDAKTGALVGVIGLP
jgi:outer membrane protein assembly factor BamB